MFLYVNILGKMKPTLNLIVNNINKKGEGIDE